MSASADSTKTQFPKQLLYLLLWVLALGLSLCYFRVADEDELVYLNDSMVMADCLRHGHWFGTEWVGVHGFLFKLPASLLFLIFGNSIFLATLVTLVLAVSSCVLCFYLLTRILGDEKLALIGVWLVSTSYYFIFTFTTFLREIPALFALLLLLNLLISEKKSWVIGIALALLLDAKEHVFFQVAFGMVLGSLFSSPYPLFSKAWLQHQAQQLFFWFLPSSVYLFLMLFTGVIPLNSFVVYILGLNQGGIASSAGDFTPITATWNQWQDGKVIFQISQDSQISASGPSVDFWNFLINSVNLSLSYLGKFLYPCSFTFLSTPKIMVVPSIIMSVVIFYRWQKEKRSWSILIWIFWGYLLIYFIRASHGRYLFAISPLLILFFLIFLKEGLLRNRLARNTLIATTLFEVFGIYFENNFIVVKLGLSILLISAFWALWWRFQRDPFSVQNSKWVHRLGILFGLSTFFVSIFSFAWSPNSQMSKYRLLGRNMEAERVSKILPQGIKIYTNWRAPTLLWFRNAERRENFSTFMPLKDFFPKKALMKHWEESSFSTFSFQWEDLPSFQEKVLELGIKKIVFFVFTAPELPTPMIETFELIKTAPWLHLSKTVPLKNKVLYLFDVLPIT